MPRIASITTLIISFHFFLSANAVCQQIKWITDLDQAKVIAQETGKPILYDFTAIWCGPCKAMDKSFWPKPEVVELANQFVAVKVDYDKNKGFAREYGVDAIPNVIFTDPWGRGLNYHQGFLAAREAEILEKIRHLPKNYRGLIEAGKALELNETDLESLHKFAVFYQDGKHYWMATSFHEKIVKLESDPRKRENILVNLAFNHIRLNKPGPAIEKLEILRKEFPNSPQNDLFLFGLTIAHQKTDKRSDAKRTLTELKTRFPESKYVMLAEQNFRGPKLAK